MIDSQIFRHSDSPTLRHSEPSDYPNHPKVRLVNRSLGVG